MSSGKGTTHKDSGMRIEILFGKHAIHIPSNALLDVINMSVVP